MGFSWVFPCFSHENLFEKAMVSVGIRQAPGRSPGLALRGSSMDQLVRQPAVVFRDDVFRDGWPGGPNTLGQNSMGNDRETMGLNGIV